MLVINGFRRITTNLRKAATGKNSIIRRVIKQHRTRFPPHILFPETHSRNEMFLATIITCQRTHWRWSRQGSSSSNRYSCVVQQQYWACVQLRGTRKSNKSTSPKHICGIVPSKNNDVIKYVWHRLYIPYISLRKNALVYKM